MQGTMEMVSIKNLDQLMAATVLPKFKEEWDEPEFEATKYMAAIFEYLLRKGMFPEQKPNIHSIAVKFGCSHTQLQRQVQGYHKPPSVQQPRLQQKKRRRVFFEESDDADTET